MTFYFKPRWRNFATSGHTGSKATESRSAIPTVMLNPYKENECFLYAKVYVSKG